MTTNGRCQYNPPYYEFSRSIHQQLDQLGGGRLFCLYICEVCICVCSVFVIMGIYQHDVWSRGFQRRPAHWHHAREHISWYTYMKAAIASNCKTSWQGNYDDYHLYFLFIYIYSFWRQNYFNRIILRIRIKVQIPFIS